MRVWRNGQGAHADAGGSSLDEIPTIDCVLALAGNPNVGKSTIFNALTGLHQHTGNWPGKTVEHAQGRFQWNGRRYALMDLPGCYSLRARSAEEEVARDFVCFGQPDAIIVVCDATCLERNLNLVLQTLEISRRVVICVNLLDEAKKKRIVVDLDKLSARLGVPVIGTTARSRRGLNALMQQVEQVVLLPAQDVPPPIAYPAYIEQAVQALAPALAEIGGGPLPSRWMALRILEQDEAFAHAIQQHFGVDLAMHDPVQVVMRGLRERFEALGISLERLRDDLVTAVVHAAEATCDGVVHHQDPPYAARDRRIDRVLTSRWIGFPVMLLAFIGVLWLTITGSNYPSELLGRALFALEQPLRHLLMEIGAPDWLREMLAAGAYRALAWVVSVMLPPMAIFFPLFTLLEDAGYLPRVAFNLDRLYQRCDACGKQALTMCMGFGCNAVGVTGCRIIDSKRERLIAILTNSFVPCNGRFPILVALIGMFFVGVTPLAGRSLVSATLLGCAILFSILSSLLASKLLSRTLLRGTASSFVLELPPFRRPQFGKVLVRSLLDRTLFVLGRAAIVAAPAGVVIWLMANCTVDGSTLLAHCATLLDPFARLMGMDGMILLAFVLGLPANEIVLPILLMAYTAQGDLQALGALSSFKELLLAHGWTPITAICVLLFSMMHWPCATTCLTIRRETRSWRWTAASIALPTAFGVIFCMAISLISRLFAAFCR